ncbi:MAG: MJ0042-type zinc finger domain-containing protein [Planctomycetota bacterium]
MLQFHCSHCQSLIQVDETHAGRQVRCSSCGSVIVAPQPELPPSHEDPPSPIEEALNPYAATTLTSEVDALPGDGNPLLVPGVALMTLSSLWCGVLLLNFVFRVVNANAQANAPIEAVVSGLIMSCALAAIHALIVFGGYSMTQRRNKASCTAACIFASIPCCCSPFWVLGMPFGIWGLVVLDRTRFR